MWARAIGLLLAGSLLGAGGLGIALGRAPDHPVSQAVRARLVQGVPALALHLGPKPARPSVESVSWGLAGAGLLLAGACALRRRRRDQEPGEGEEVAGEGGPEPGLDRRTLRKLEKQAKSLARQGHFVEAAELCFVHGLRDRAVELFIEGGDLVRAAEVRHDQNLFLDAAELYQKAGQLESAGTIFAAQNEPARAAECFLGAGRKSVAAEMLEKAGDHRRAADCYADAGFQRHAAQAYLRAQEWGKAAEALEQTLLDEAPPRGGAVDPRKQKEQRRLVVQAAKLYEQAGQIERAQQVLEKGECATLAAEIALRRERFAEASELFLKGNEPQRAAEALRRLGEGQAAARILGDFHRGRGEDEEAARHFEEAADFVAAGDLYRKLEDYERAGRCYEGYGDFLQAAEMYQLAGDLTSAASAFERASRHEDAAACHAQLGDGRREADCLVRAGRLLQAGETYHRHGADDEAIKALQRIDPSHADFQAGCALLGEIFQGRGMLSLAIKKLDQAASSEVMGRDNLGVFYTLATVHEANGALQEALDLYEKILAFDYHFEDVEERLTKLRQRHREAAARQDAAVAEAVGPARSGRYETLGEIGRGGMGIVYKAKDTVLDRIVAYKVLPDTLKENPQALRNFLREAKSAAQLNHPNIVTVYDAGEQDGRYYIAMEYVDGITLKEILRKRGAIAPRGVLHVLVQMCEALAYAHEKKIVHRDVKTANTMWTRERKAKIMDFGLAKVVEEVRNHTTLISGTPYYMSPEQTLGRNVDHRTDIYSLGVTLFELATGKLPFREGNIPYHHVHTAPPDPREVNPALPSLIGDIIARCLRKDPAERFQSTREILAAVQAALARRKVGAAPGPGA